MAGTGRTPKLGLALYEADNTVSMLNTFNNNMNVIDTAVDKAQIAADAAEAATTANATTIEKLNEELANTNETVAAQGVDVDGLKTNYTALAGKVNVNEGNITTMQGQISTLMTNDTQQNAEIGELQEQVAAISVPVPDWNNILKDFKNNDNPYTATDYCWVIGVIVVSAGTSGSGTDKIAINGNDVCVASFYSTSALGTTTPVNISASIGLLISPGDTVTFERSAISHTTNSLPKIYGLKKPDTL